MAAVYRDDLGWVLTGYAEIQAALRDSRLSAGTVDAAEHARFRKTARAYLSSAAMADRIANVPPPAVPSGVAVDLLHEVASPWALDIAMALTKSVERERETLSRLAREVFLAAAEPFEEALQTGCAAAAARLAALLGDSIAVQAFVAVAETLPAFLAGAWLALLEHPDQTRLLCDKPDRLQAAIEELFRYVSPARAQFRRAVDNFSFNGLTIEPGQRVTLLLAEANRDPAVFPSPDVLDLRRTAIPHLGFGAGPHACAGAALVRNLAVTATAAFLANYSDIELCGEVQWQPWFAIRSPRAVLVRRS